MGLIKTDSAAVENIDTPTETAETTTTTEKETPEVTGFHAMLDEKLRSNPALQTFQDVNALANSYIHAQQLIGKNKIVIPDQHATDEDWEEVFTKLGKPKESAAYLKAFDDKKEEFNDFDKAFLSTAFKSNLLPKQARELYDLVTSAQTVQTEQEEADHKEIQERDLAVLKEKWGNAYDKNILKAQNAFSTFASDEQGEYLASIGLDNDPILIELFASIGDKLGEDTFVGMESVGGLTPAEAQKRIDTIMDNSKHPYHISGHLGHDNAVQEM